ELINHNRPVFDQLHPSVPMMAAGLVAWFVLAAWVFFDRQGVIGLSLAIVTVLFGVVGLLLDYLGWSDCFSERYIWSGKDTSRPTQGTRRSPRSGIGTLAILPSGAASFTGARRRSRYCCRLRLARLVSRRWEL